MDRSLRLSQASSSITDEGSKPEILSRIAQTTAALTRLKPVWNDRSISLSSKIQLMRSLVKSIFLYACESWILTAELQRRIQAMEIRCYRKILRISYKDHVTNEEVRAKIQVPASSPSRGGDVTVYVCDINQPSLPIPFYSVLVNISVFMALSTVFHSLNSPDNSPFSQFVLPVLFLPYRSFQLSLYESLPQP